MDESEIFPVCDFCSSKLADVYCGADSANLCLFCDRHVHSANALSFNHTRQSICADNRRQGSCALAQSHAPCVMEFEDGHTKVKMELCEQLADMARGDSLRSDADDHYHEAEEDDEYDDELLTSMMLMPIKYDDEEDLLCDYNPTHDSSLMWEFRVESSNESEEPGVLIPKRVVSNTSEDNRSTRAGTEKDLANSSSEYDLWKETKSKEAIDIHTEDRGNAMLRYMEKKKTRRYDKHVRYESRKARASVRTRVKGRFVKSPEDL